MKIMPSVAKQQFLLFLAMGALSTAVTYALYLLFCLYINYQLAYFLAYLIGIIISYYLNVLFVFDKQVSLSAFLRFPLVYAFQYIIGAVFLGVFVEQFGISKSLAPLIILLLTLPMSFFLSRYILSRY